MNEEMKPLVCVEDVADQCFRTGRDSELFLDPKTGDVWKVSDNPRYANPDMSMEEALDLEQSHGLLRLPKAQDLQELDIMDEYIDYVPEPLQRDLTGILRQQMPFQAYRTRLEKAGLLEDYVQYRNERGGDSVADWCDEHELGWRHQIVPGRLSAAYETKQLTVREAGDVYWFMKKNGLSCSMRQIRTDICRVPGSACLDQKFYVGWYDEKGGLAAVADLVLDFPAPLQARITSIMADEKIRDSILADVERGLARAGFAHLETRADNENEEAFFTKNGYAPAERKAGSVILCKEQALPEEDYVPEFDDNPGVWTF